MQTLITSLLLLAVGHCYAQNIVTDRPDQTEASSTIPLGSLQMEMGFQVTRTSGASADFRDIAAPNLLLRYGLTQGIELRAITEYASNSTSFSNESYTLDGFQDLALGAKFQLLRKEDVSTEIALLSHVILPSGSDNFSGDVYGLENRFSISHNLGEKSSVGYNLGYNMYEKSNGVAIYTLALGTAVGEKGGVYIEPFGEYDFDSSSLESSFDAGFTYLLKPNMQIDLSFGVGLNHNMNYLATGFSWNIPAE